MAKTPIPKKLLLDPGHLLSFGFGSGLAPKAPGTFGTLASIPVFIAYSLYLPEIYQYGFILVSFIIGIWLCERTTKALGVHDHPAIVWDEFVGFFITMIMVPVTPVTILMGFVLFRIFDILKPWPISVIDSRLKGGLGVMLDDVLAGVYALLCMHLILWIARTI